VPAQLPCRRHSPCLLRRDDALALYDDFGQFDDGMPNYCQNDTFTLLQQVSPNVCCFTDNIMTSGGCCLGSIATDDQGDEFCAA
jgi:hypothetical protein